MHGYLGTEKYKEYKQLKEFLKFGNHKTKQYKEAEEIFKKINYEYEIYMYEKNKYKQAKSFLPGIGFTPNYLKFRKGSTYLPRNDYKKAITKINKYEKENFEKFS